MGYEPRPAHNIVFVSHTLITLARLKWAFGVGAGRGRGGRSPQTAENADEPDIADFMIMWNR
jgi:hypothetical protein